ncbi:uncharacterized protein F5147DRAFT_775184 [Suillus discolor]|uniref:Uncharacterized protein n=1 Tax=Suillus discolor TaxID=1912936 RepID=A0A9P7JSE6_9AGAM|nr:uncharacterized protein F5147DRAFT_775184 [Suillus discolor]KAG2105872.1 hypothetical protein F5147DRAFT_775184 [Suillus discolor]
MSIQVSLDNTEFSLVLDALQLMQSELAVALANRLLSHNPPSPHSTKDDPVGGKQYAGGRALSDGKGSHRMQPYRLCPRNSRNLAMGGRWTIGEKTACSSNVSAEAFIGVIAAMDTGLQSDLAQWMESICSVASEIQLSGATVMSLTYRCKVWGRKGVGWSLISMVNYMQLAMKCQSMIDSSTNYSDLYETLPVDRPTIRTFLFWIATGFKFMHLAAGGSFYLLILVATKDLRWTVTRMQANVPWEIAKMLRRPNACENDLQVLIERRIIPIIYRLRKALPLSMPGAFVALDREVDWTCIRDTDRLFDGVNTNNYQLPSRCKSAWRSCLDPCWDETLSLGCITRSFGDVGAATALTASPAVRLLHLPEFFDDSTSIKTLPKLISIETAFDCEAPENLHNPVNGNKVQNLLWTIEQQKIVEESAVTIIDTEDLKAKLSTFYPSRIKQPDTYIKIPMSILPGALEIRNLDGSLMVFICNFMPPSMRDTLFPLLKSAFDCLEVFKNRTMLSISQETQDPEAVLQSEANEPFRCIHFSHWNRYGLSGNTAPADMHPHDLVATSGRTNLTQTLPYMSRETFEYEQLYLNIQNNLREVFEWIEQTVAHYLPDDYTVLAELVDILPNAGGSLVKPFLSLVVNINVCTIGHRDGKDYRLCLVLPIGSFVGGGLVMREQGVVVEIT